MSSPAPPIGPWEGEEHMLDPEHFPDDRQRKIVAVINEIRPMAKEGEHEEYEGEGNKGIRKAVQDDVTPILQFIAALKKPRHMFEAGTAYGFSGLYLGLGAPDARMTTVEFDPKVAQMAQEHFDRAGLKGFRVLPGNALDAIQKLTDNDIDLVFFDHNKESYLPDFRALEPHLAAGAIVLADNVNDRRHQNGDFVDYVLGSSDYPDATVVATNAGLLVATKAT